MSGFGWRDYLAAFHAAKPGAVEAVLGRSYAGGHTPYRWLARSVAPRANLVIDLACGSGAMNRELIREGRTVVGVDLSIAELQLAATRSSGPWLCADALSLPFSDESVDAVTSSLGVVVVQPTSRLFDEVARVLRPGGVFAFTTPTLRPLSPGDLEVVTQITRYLKTPPQFPLPTEFTGYVPALARAGLGKAEDARECYRFKIEDPQDATDLIASLYLPTTPQRRKGAAIGYLLDRLAAKGPFAVAIPMRRFVALK